MGDPQRITAHYVFESTNGNDEGLMRYMVNAAKSGGRHARDAVVYVEVRDADGNYLGSDTTGDPSEEMESAIDALHDE